MKTNYPNFFREPAVRALEAVMVLAGLVVLAYLAFNRHRYQLLGLHFNPGGVLKYVVFFVTAFILRSFLTDRSFLPFRLAAIPWRWILNPLGLPSRQGLNFRNGIRVGFLAGITAGVLGAVQYRYFFPTLGYQTLAVVVAGLAGGMLGGLGTAIYFYGFKKLVLRAERIFLAFTFSAGVAAVTAYFHYSEAWGTEPILRPMLAAAGIALAGAIFFFLLPAGLAEKKQYFLFYSLLVLSVGGWLFLCWRSSQSRAQQTLEAGQPHRRLLFITIDTLRADHLSGYGYSRPTSPVLDQLASRGIRFSEAYSPLPLTDPSHLAMLTGYYPRTLGVSQVGPPIAKPNLPSLAAFFREKGWATGAIVSRCYLRPSGLGLQGFDYESGPSPRLPEARAEETFRRAANWLSENYQKDFFLWVHFYDPHLPYDPPDRFAQKFTSNYQGPRMARKWIRQKDDYSPEEISYFVSLYDGEIGYVDETIGRLLHFLDQLLPKEAEAPLVLVVADHGEILGELQDRYDYAFGHGEFLYQSQIHVPLIISWPGHLPENLVVQDQVDLVDLAPTLVELLFPGEPFPCQGLSFAPAVQKAAPWPRSWSFAQRRTYRKPPAQEFLRGEQYMVVQGPIKLIYGTAGTSELYNLETDLSENRNLADENPKLRDELLQAGRDWESRTPYTEPRSRSMDREQHRALRNLGYVQ